MSISASMQPHARPFAEAWATSSLSTWRLLDQGRAPVWLGPRVASLEAGGCEQDGPHSGAPGSCPHLCNLTGSFHTDMPHAVCLFSTGCLDSSQQLLHPAKEDAESCFRWGNDLQGLTVNDRARV